MSSLSPAGAITEGVTAIIPAWNEESTIARVIDTVKQSPWIDDIIVVNNNSSDNTAAVAAEAGARIVHMPVPGKGQAMAAGVAAAGTRHIMFADADLTGFTTDHIEQIVKPVVTGEAETSRGLFDKGRITELRAKVLPVLTGERVMDRSMFEALRLSEVTGFTIETSLNRYMAQNDIESHDVVLRGMSHIEKRDKHVGGFVAGMLDNWKALGHTQLSRMQWWGRHFSGAHEIEPFAVDAARGAMIVEPAAANAVRHLL